jgi:hypothetical protein
MQMHDAHKHAVREKTANSKNVTVTPVDHQLTVNRLLAVLPSFLLLGRRNHPYAPSASHPLPHLPLHHLLLLVLQALAAGPPPLACLG